MRGGTEVKREVLAFHELPLLTKGTGSAKFNAVTDDTEWKRAGTQKVVEWYVYKQRKGGHSSPWSLFFLISLNVRWVGQHGAEGSASDS